MWFKRRKKSEQDHALSQSLKSLQTLLNDTGRVEPSLERPDPDAAHQDTESDGARRQPRLSSREDSNGVDEERGDVRLGSSARSVSTTSDSGNRWQDLNLSFDAEPVVPRPRRGSQDDEQSTDHPPETEPAPQEAAPTTPADTGEAEHAENEAPAAESPAQPGTPEPKPGDDTEEPEDSIIEDYGSRPTLAPAIEKDPPSGLDLNEFAGPNPGEPELEIDLGTEDEEATDAEREPGEVPGSEAIPSEIEAEVEEIEVVAPPDSGLAEDEVEVEAAGRPEPSSPE